MLRIETRTDTPQEVTYALSGKVRADHIADLDARLAAAQAAGRRVTLDLAGVLVVDRETVTWLASGRGSAATLANCPAYVLSWILCEGGKSKRSTP